MNTRPIVYIGLLVAMIVFVTACAGTPTAAPTTTAPQATATTLVTPTSTTATATIQVTPTSAPATSTVFPQSGNLFDVGGYQLYIECRGEGSPTVILDSGFGGTHSVWNKVQPGVAAFTRVCSYDRADRGKSDKGPWTWENPNSALLMARQLKSLLEGAHVDPPYIMVGQSFGGMVVRLYGSAYPTDVAGMVLVDAATDESYEDMGIEIADAVSLKASIEQVRNAGPFPNIPLIVLTHGDPGKGPRLSVSEPSWQEFQRHLLKLSPQSEQIIAKQSGHNIHTDQPDLVIDAIRQVFKVR